MYLETRHFVLIDWRLVQMGSGLRMRNQCSHIFVRHFALVQVLCSISSDEFIRIAGRPEASISR